MFRSPPFQDCYSLLVQNTPNPLPLMHDSLPPLPFSRPTSSPPPPNTRAAAETILLVSSSTFPQYHQSHHQSQVVLCSYQAYSAAISLLTSGHPSHHNIIARLPSSSHLLPSPQATTSLNHKEKYMCKHKIKVWFFKLKQLILGI